MSIPACQCPLLFRCSITRQLNKQHGVGEVWRSSFITQTALDRFTQLFVVLFGNQGVHHAFFLQKSFNSICTFIDQRIMNCMCMYKCIYLERDSIYIYIFTFTCYCNVYIVHSILRSAFDMSEILLVRLGYTMYGKESHPTALDSRCLLCKLASKGTWRFMLHGHLRCRAM